MKRILAFIMILSLPAITHAEKIEQAKLTFAPEVPRPVLRKKPAVVRVNLDTIEKEDILMPGLEKDTRYVFWTFNGKVPGPFIRLRVGDTMELRITNPKDSGMDHNVDFHAVTGPGGGAKVTFVKPGETKTARFKMLNPGLYVYHCAAPPVSHHIANGMYGLILVEPEYGLPKVNREFYVMQGEFYTTEEFGEEGLQSFSSAKAEAEHPTYIVFNGRIGALLEDRALQAKTGEKIRIFFGNAGPNLVSSFHIIGTIFDKVYREGSLSEPSRNVQTTLVPAGSASTVEFQLQVPGDYALVDHSIFRTEKGAIGTLKTEGKERPEIYTEIK
jgi:nitrite reductase (NO-forming)